MSALLSADITPKTICKAAGSVNPWTGLDCSSRHSSNSAGPAIPEIMNDVRVILVNTLHSKYLPCRRTPPPLGAADGYELGEWGVGQCGGGGQFSWCEICALYITLFDTKYMIRFSSPCRILWSTCFALSLSFARVRSPVRSRSVHFA